MYIQGDNLLGAVRAIAQIHLLAKHCEEGHDCDYEATLTENVTQTISNTLHWVYINLHITIGGNINKYYIPNPHPNHRPDHLVFLRDQLSPHTLPPCLCQTPCCKKYIEVKLYSVTCKNEFYYVL